MGSLFMGGNASKYAVLDTVGSGISTTCITHHKSMIEIRFSLLKRKPDCNCI